MFKNLQVYRLPAPWAVNADQLASALATQAFTPASSNELLRQGFEPPREGGALVHAVAGQFLLQLKTEKKVMPAAAVRAVAKAKAAEFEEQQGFPPGKKAMKELKERAADEMLPRAFTVPSVTRVWIDPVNGWLVIDAAAAGKADDVIKLLLKAVDKMPLESLRVQSSPVTMMTAWLRQEASALEYDLTIDCDATLRSTGEGKAQVGLKNHSLDPEDIHQHLSAGKQCTRLAMTWNSRISFVLTESLVIKGVKPLDILKEVQAGAANEHERFDNDFALMAGELAKLLADLVGALGGEAKA